MGQNDKKRLSSETNCYKMRPTGSIPKCQTQHFKLNVPDQQQSLLVVVLKNEKESVSNSHLVVIKK